MTRDYTSYLMNKVNQYKDSDALRIAGLGLATLYWKGISGFNPQYYVSNMSLTDLIIEELIATYTVNDDIYEVRKEWGPGVVLYSGFNTDMPAVFNESNFTGSIEDRTIPRGSPLDYLYLEWMHGGSATQYGTTMSVKFTNGTKLFAEAPGYMNVAWGSAPGTYVKFTIHSYWGTDRVIEKIVLDWPAANVGLLIAEIESKDNPFYDDFTLVYPSTFGPGGFEFEGTIADRTLEPNRNPYSLSFFFAGSTQATGYTVEVWFDNGEYKTYSN